MYAIVEIGGQQHKVEKDQRLYVNRLEAAEGANLEFEKVMLTDKDGNVTIGLPFIDGARVAAHVVSHVKDDKIHIFKHKRRKGYRRFNGHRQSLTELFIHGILEKGETFVADPAKYLKKKKTTAKADVAAETEAADVREKATDAKTTVKKKKAPEIEKTALASESEKKAGEKKKTATKKTSKKEV